MRTLQTPIGSGFGPSSTAADVIRNVDLHGKTAVVTGGAAGLGRETVRQLAAAGAHVIVPARSPQAAHEALRESAKVTIVPMDLTDGASIERFASDFLNLGLPLEILVNSAGVMAIPLQYDARGIEKQFSVNHLGHFQLTRALWPALRKARGARVVTLSSRAHFFTPVDFDDPNFRDRPYDPWISYGQAKSACALFAVAIDLRGKAEGIRAFSVHPGSILTGLARHFSREALVNAGAIDLVGNLIVDPENDKKTVEQGAATQVWCAVSPALAEMGGVYCENCDIAVPAPHDPKDRRGVKPWASDPDLARRLWSLSAGLLA